MTQKPPEDRLRTQMVIPVSKGSYFNTNWTPTEAALCPYDMLYHPPDYNPKSARSDRQEPKIIKRNIWDQVQVRASLLQLEYIWLRFTGYLISEGLTSALIAGPKLPCFLELHRGIPSTTHFQLGRPKWRILDIPTKQFVRVQVKNENPHMRIEKVLEWAILLDEGKPMCE